MTGTEVRSMKDDEIKIELGKLRNKLYDMRTKRVSDTVEDTSQFSKAKKDIARMLTEQRSRGLKKAGK